MTTNQFNIQIKGLSKDLAGMRRVAQERVLKEEVSKFISIAFKNLSKRINENPFSSYYYTTVDRTECSEEGVNFDMIRDMIFEHLELNDMLDSYLKDEEMSFHIKDKNEFFIGIEARIKEDRA